MAEVIKKEEDLGIVETELIGLSATDEDIPGIRLLLNQLFKQSDIDTNELAKLIVSQSYVGCTLKQDIQDDDDDDDDDDVVLGVCSVINMMAKKDLPVVQQLKKYILDTPKLGLVDHIRPCKYLQSLFYEYLGNTVGLIIKEKLMNLTPMTTAPMLSSLVADIEAAKKKGMPYAFTHYLYISKAYITLDGEDAGVHVYVDEEDEWLDSIVTTKLDFYLPQDREATIIKSDGEQINVDQFRRIFVLEKEDLPSFLKKCEEDAAKLAKKNKKES